MPRIARAENLGDLHHVWARSVSGEVLFRDDEDREDYLLGAEMAFRKTGTRCLAWCLMPNHVHFAVQTGGEKLSRVIQSLHTRHVVRFNKRWERRGSLFDGRFGSRVVTDTENLLVAMGYVLLNVPRAQLCIGLEGLAGYRWSAYRELMGLAPPRLVDVPFVLAVLGGTPDQGRLAMRKALAARLEATANDQEFAAVSLLPRDQFDLQVPGETEISGGSRTVFRVATESGSASLIRRTWMNRGGTVESLLSTICGLLGVSPAGVSAGRRRREESKARALFAHVGCDLLRLPLAAIARASGVAPQSVSEARPPGRLLLQEIGISLEEILELSIREATGRVG